MAKAKGIGKKSLSEEERLRKELDKLLGEQEEQAAWYDRYTQENKIEFFKPNPKQVKIVLAWIDPIYKTFTFTGGERSGKTTILTVMAISTVIGKMPFHIGGDEEPDISFLFPHSEPRKVRYVGQDWKTHIETVVLPELRKWWPKSRPVKTKGNGVISDAIWTDVKTGSTIEIVSNSQEARLLRGWHGDLICYDEPPKRDIYIANARGLVDRRGREFIAATLLAEPWVHQEIIKKRNPDGTPTLTICNVNTTMYDNVGYGITKEGAKAYEDKLTEEERKSRIYGIPDYLSGLVYPQFKRKTHLKDRFKVPLDWLIDIAIDVHPREKQAVLFEAIAPDNRKYLIEEIWDHGDGTWIGQEIVKCIDFHGWKRVNRIICDPLAKGDKNQPNTTYDKINNELMKWGYVLETASKDKSSGILLVKEHLMGPNLEPSMFFFNDLKRATFEIEGYMWDEDTQKPKDKDDHMMENLYRLCLLSTEWYPVEWEDEGHSPLNDGRSAIGGY